MKATLLLCDSAQFADGLVNITGGGRTWIWAHTVTPLGVAAFFDLDPSELGQEIAIHLSVTHLDGTPVQGTDDQGKTFTYGIADTVTTPSNEATSYDAELDFVWSANWFGIAVAPGTYQMRLTKEATGEVVGTQTFTAYQPS